jgi:DNA end-binding protein Ku
MRKALAQTNKLGIGEIAFSGREHLVAIGAPLDPKQKGLMLYTLRYEEELRDSQSALTGLKEASVDADELSLAKQLTMEAPRRSICPPTRTTMKLRSKAG